MTTQIDLPKFHDGLSVRTVISAHCGRKPCDEAVERLDTYLASSNGYGNRAVELNAEFVAGYMGAGDMFADEKGYYDPDDDGPETDVDWFL
jgi:hypothetical protein